jgi:hypothetical protein
MTREITTTGSYTLNTQKGAFRVNLNHFAVVEKPAAGDSAQFRYGNVSIDTTITEGLKEELLIREVTRSIQMLRKKIGLTRIDKIHTKIAADGHILKSIERAKGQISEVTRSSRIDLAAALDSNAATESAQIAEVEVFGKTLKIKVSHRKGRGEAQD